MEAKRLPRYPINNGRNSETPLLGDKDNASPECGHDWEPHRFGSATLILNTRSEVGRSAAAAALDYLGLLGVPGEQYTAVAVGGRHLGGS